MFLQWHKMIFGWVRWQPGRNVPASTWQCGCWFERSRDRNFWWSCSSMTKISWDSSTHSTPFPKHTTQLDYQIGGESHGKWRNRSVSFCSFVRWFWIETHTKRHKLEMKGRACSHYSIRPAHVLLAHQMEQRRLGNNKKHIIVTTHKRYKTVKTCVTARLV